jgi:hypothetical protein
VPQLVQVLYSAAANEFDGTEPDELFPPWALQALSDRYVPPDWAKVVFFLVPWKGDKEAVANGAPPLYPGTYALPQFHLFGPISTGLYCTGYKMLKNLPSDTRKGPSKLNSLATLRVRRLLAHVSKALDLKPPTIDGAFR